MSPDPARVNARIAALKDEHPDYWLVPEALAEAKALWGGGCNDHGVFCRFEKDDIVRMKDCHASVLIAESGNGLFGYGLEYQFGTGGGNVFPAVWREAFGSRAEARQAGIADLIEHVGRHPVMTADKRRDELLRRISRQGRQLTLFD